MLALSLDPPGSATSYLEGLQAELIAVFPLQYIQICNSPGNYPGMLLAMGGLAGNLILQQLLATPTTG
jgi:hypothetical protein